MQAATSKHSALRVQSQHGGARTPAPPRMLRCRSFLPLNDLPPLDPVMSEQGATYATLAALAGSFGLTFGVAPRFKTLFREPDTWREIYGQLLDMGGVDSIAPADAVGAVKKGAVIVDVRLNQRFEAGAIDGSDNFPLYQPISGWSFPANIRRAGFAFFGVYGTERNAAWMTEIESWIPKDQEVIVACEMGGSMECKPGADTGFQSQSLKALYYLKKAGYQKVRHLKGGVAEYMRTVGPLVPPGDMQDKALSQGRVRA